MLNSCILRHLTRDTAVAISFVHKKGLTPVNEKLKVLFHLNTVCTYCKQTIHSASTLNTIHMYKSVAFTTASRSTPLCVGLNSQPVGSVLFFFVFQALKFLHEKGIPYGKYYQQAYSF